MHQEREAAIAWLRERSLRLFVAEAHASRSVYQEDLTQPLALAFGNEARGADERLKREADALLWIPILGKAESLNVAVSASICLYEAVRQRMARAR